MRLGNNIISTHSGIAASISKTALAKNLNNTEKPATKNNNHGYSR